MTRSPGNISGDLRYADLLAAWSSLKASHAVFIREIACVGAPRTLVCIEIDPMNASTVTLVSGVHGDEPAAPWALFSLVRDRLLDRRFGYRIWPCTNPTGYDAGTRESAEGIDINRTFSRGGSTPESRAILTANRDHHFALSIDLHEDHEATGFYGYETLVERTPRYRDVVTSAIERAGYPLQTIHPGYDLGTPPEAASAQDVTPGWIAVDAKKEAAFFSGLPFTLAMSRRAAPRALTFESPRTRGWDERIACHRIAVTAAIAATKAT
jgi:protein MpaA